MAEVDAALAKEPDAVLLLHHLGDGGDPKIVAKARHRFQECPALTRRESVAYVNAVDLDDIHVQCPEVLEGRRAGAEVVETDLVAGLAQALDRPVDGFEVDDLGRFGDLEQNLVAQLFVLRQQRL